MYFLLNATAPTEVYTLSLHDALPIYLSLFRSLVLSAMSCSEAGGVIPRLRALLRSTSRRDRKSTRLNSSHVAISYAVFCLKKKICRRSAHTAVRNRLQTLAMTVHTLF